jgi:integrase
MIKAEVERLTADIAVSFERLSDKQLEFVNNNETIKRTILRVYRKSQSEKSVSLYTCALMNFIGWLNEEPDKAILKQRDWSEVVNNYIDQLVASKLAPYTIRGRIVAVKKWLKVNGIQLDKEKVEVPQAYRVESERIPTKAELREILKGAKLSDRLMVSMLVAGGFRVGTLLKLRLKDIDLTAKYPTVVVSPEISKGRIGYLAFINEEAKGFLELSIKERELQGEKIIPDSLIICTSRPQGAEISVGGADWRWIQLLKKSGKNNKKRAWNDMRIHTLRKYFKSWATLSGVDRDLVEALMGHRSSIAQRYFLTNIEQGLNPDLIKKAVEEYAKAAPALTIFDGDEKVKELEQKVEEQKKQLEAKENEWETRFAAMSAQINAMRDILSKAKKFS